MPTANIRCSLFLAVLLAGQLFGLASPRTIGIPSQAAQPVDELIAKLAEAKTDTERAALLDANKELLNADLTAKLRETGNQFILRRKWQEASNAFLAMKDAATRLNDRVAIATSFRGLGGALYGQNKIEQAIEAFKQSLTFCQETCSKADLMRSMVNITKAYNRLSDYSAALAYLKRAEPLIGDLHDKLLTADFFNTAGLVHKNIGDYSQALPAYRQSLAIYQSEHNEDGIIGTQLNMGVIYQNVGEYGQALESFQPVLLASVARNNKPLMSQSMNNIGLVHFNRGDYAKSLEFYQKSLLLKEELGDRLGAAVTQANIASVYQRQGNLAQALIWNHRALDIRILLKNQRGVAESYQSLASVLNEQKQYDKAEEYYGKALQLSEEIKSVELQAGLLSSLGGFYNNKKDIAKASEALDKAATLFKSFNSKSGLGEVLYNRALVYLDQNKPEEALKLAEQAYLLAANMGNLFFQWVAKEAAGRALVMLGETARSQQHFEDAIRIIETMRAQAAGGEQESERFFEGMIAPYYEMVKSLVAENKNSEAFYYGERAKGRVLLDVLQNGRADVKKAMTAGEREQEQVLKIEMASLNNQKSREAHAPKPDQANANDLKARLQKAHLEYDSFRDKLYAAHPDLRIKRGDAQIIKAEETAQLLPDADTALLSYVAADNAAYLFVMTRAATTTGVDFKRYTLPIAREELSNLVSRFREQLGARDPEFRPAAKHLFELLLGPAQAQLRGKTNLIISPDAALWELPFQALLCGANRYLIEEAAVSYVPSLTVLREMMKQRKHLEDTGAKTLTLLAIGNPFISKETSERAKASRRDEKLESLPEAEHEVKALAQIYGAGQSRIYTGAEAREDRVKTEAGNFKILHLATHGILNDSSPMYSHLVLAQGGVDDGLLEAWELMGTDLHAELVVLSACETARGRVSAGEGVIGLSWALFVAGSPTTVVSQWKVDSAGTSELMLEFHKTLNAGARRPAAHISKAGALRVAALSLLKSTEYRHPFYWAGFSVIGDGR